PFAQAKAKKAEPADAEFGIDKPTSGKGAYQRLSKTTCRSRPYFFFAGLPSRYIPRASARAGKLPGLALSEPASALNVLSASRVYRSSSVLAPRRTRLLAATLLPAG